MKKRLNVKIIFCLLFCALLLVGIFVSTRSTKSAYKKVQSYQLHTYNSNNNVNQKLTFSDNSSKENQVLYLSDIPYRKAQVGWGNLSLDKTQDNAAFTMLLNGSSTVIKKGIWAHATSTIEYDIREYRDYAYFTAFCGINNTSGNRGNGVKFYVYTSEDGENWTLRTEENPAAIKSSNNAAYVKIDIRNANYIKLYAHDNGSNASDHVVWGDAKLVTEDYKDNVMPTVEEYDEIIKASYERGAVKDELKLTLLQRDFIKRIGQYQLRNFLEGNQKHKETLEWFLNNEEALRLWTVGGTPNGTYIRALEVLSDVYQAHKEDLENENLTANGTKYKDLYLKMMLSLSLSHSINVPLWITGSQFSNAVTRYEIYKQMHLDNKLESNRMFESYTIEEMRAVMFTNIDDEEILWLRDYSAKRYPNREERLNSSKYVRYTTGYGYYRPQYYSQENYAKWDAKYDLSKYNITYGKTPKLWIVFEEGAVCGGISKTAANLYGVWGYPAKVLGQPGHAAYAYLYDAGGGNNAWQLAYNVASTGWAQTGSGGRMPNGWGNGWSSGVIDRGSYHFLSQQAQNEYDKYEKAELILLQADTFKNDREKLNQIYRDALAEEIINFDAWVGLISLCNSDSSKTDEERIALAEEIAEVMTYHPLPMYDLTKLISTKISSPEYSTRIMMIQEQTLRKAAKATGANTLYYKEVPVVANAILGVVDASVANFSFNGANAGKIILSKQLQSAQVTWTYSLDGGNTWVECYEHSVQLTAEEIASINVNDDIKVHISGLPMNEANIYTIDITKRAFPSGVITINDEENRILNARSDMEWTLDPNGEWTSFSVSNPVFNGNTRVYVRVTAEGTQVSSDPVYYTFTENNSDDTKWYIQSKNLKVVEVNATGAGSWANMLDGNINTYYRSKDGYMPAYVTIQIDEPRYISGLDYVPDKSAKLFGKIPYGRARNVKIYVSMDKQNWELAATKNNIGDNDALKHIDFPEPKKALYVKFECQSVYPGDYNMLTVSVLKLYENVIVNKTPRAEVNYNITTATNKDVTAELINETRDITVTNNDGKKTYTFTENGDFTFEFVDNDGNKGETTAHVNWIDKTLPKAEVSFSTTELTNEDVVATIAFDKPNITILSKDVNIAENPVDKSKTITFETNATYELEFADALGNIGTKTIAVDWIDKEKPTAELSYSTVNLTDEPVTVTIEPSEEVTVLNNNGEMAYTFEENGTFTFEFVDKAGNKGTATANVNWIAKVPEYTLTYSTEELTNQDVIVTLEIEEGYRIVSNNGSNIYTFTENAESSFEYVDENGNRGVIPISVDWIDKEVPVATISYDITTPTNKSVTASITFNEENVTVKDGNTHVFEDNAEYTFEFEDRAGNKGTAVAKVDWIKKTLPNAIFEYDIDTLTNQDVTVTVKFDREGTKITNNGGKDTYTFVKNGSFEFEFVGPYGNAGVATATVDWIDKVAPTAKVTYDITTETEENVVATLGSVSEEITITNNDGKDTYTFTKNGTFTFEFEDKVGNKGTAKAEVTWIKTAEDKYQEAKAKAIEKIESYQSKVSNDEIENKKINAKEKSEVISAYDSLRDEDKAEYTEFINRLKAGGKPTITKILTETIKYKVGEEIDLYSLITIKDNEDGEIVANEENVKITTNLNIQKAGNYDITYEVTDSDGNTSNLTIQVVIVNNEPDESNITSSEYEIAENIIRKIPLNLEVNEFMKHIQAKKEVIIKDKNQNILKGTSKIGTGMKAYVGESVYTFVVKADLDGNGTVNLTDLAKMCLHYIEQEALVDEYLEAADIDDNNKITITDLAKMQLLLIQNN